jgi:hypothetical protein
MLQGHFVFGLIAGAMVLLVSVAPISAAEVLVLDEAGYGGPIGGFYNGSYGGPPSSAAYISGDLSTQDFTGAKLLWALPADDFTVDEMATLSAFLNGGGRIGFLGEWYGVAGARNGSINAAVATLGGHISIDSTYADNGYPHYAYRSNGKILDDPFTVGVNSVVYGLFSPLSLSGGAKALVLGEDGSSVLLAREDIGAGKIFVMADQAPWDLDPYSAGTDTRTLLANILIVPEPATMTLMLAGGLVLIRRRRAA